ncbi:hypothetical protein CL622_05370 [archaeon]|nr:hypothetical protein [archaeon]|tara:strand:- start:520 stop:906 length:387 start_codon:yes stop_codon:yes gene_type:complete
MIFDSSFIIDMIKGDPLAAQKFVELNKRNNDLRTTSINVYEVLLTTRLSSTKEKRRIHRMLNRLQILGLDLTSAKHAADIRNSLITKGKTIGGEDAMIAGIAKKHNEAVLTKNIKHFNRIKGITVETY